MAALKPPPVLPSQRRPHGRAGVPNAASDHCRRAERTRPRRRPSLRTTSSRADKTVKRRSDCEPERPSTLGFGRVLAARAPARTRRGSPRQLQNATSETAVTQQETAARTREAAGEKMASRDRARSGKRRQTLARQARPLSPKTN